jgi:hypothetical protein
MLSSQASLVDPRGPAYLRAKPFPPLLAALLALCACPAGSGETTESSADATTSTGTAAPTSTTGTTGDPNTGTTGAPTTGPTSTTAATTTTTDETTTGAEPTTGGSETTGAGSSTGEPAIPPECDGIAPSPDPAVNHAAILACLNNFGVARLAPGEFPVAAEIDMPAGSRLLGDATWPRIKMVAKAQSLVRVHDDCEVAFLRLDGNDQMTVAHNAIVRLLGNNGFVHDNHVQNGDGVASLTDHVTGVRFWDPTVTGNRVFRNQIHNLLEDNKIYEVRCDGVTFRGYGRAHGNEIHHVGFQCLNPPESPIPGGGFYTLNNFEGFEIVGNHVHETCGQPLDLDRAANLVIKDNLIEKPGFSWDGHKCGAGIAGHLLDIRDSLIEGNTFRNTGFTTIKSDPNHVMSADGSGVPSDMPSGANQAVAFALTHREGKPETSTHNTIKNNKFIANCQAPCVGLGYFIGRGTGFAANKTWSADTTNYFTGNSAFGSNIGSKRCGGGWFAANSDCKEGMLEPECNADDPQHEGPGHDWTRSDNCPHYQ